MATTDDESHVLGHEIKTLLNQFLLELVRFTDTLTDQ